jgi:type IV pilus assembly protein PilA
MLAQAIKRRLSKEENQKGFTLIELLAVIVILGIIAVIAIPMIGNIINKSKSDSDLATARQIYDAARLFVTAEDNGDFDGKSITIKDTATTTKDLTQNGYLEGTIYLPSTKEVISGGVVVFDADGNLDSVDLYTTKFPSTTPKHFVGADVLKQ